MLNTSPKLTADSPTFARSASVSPNGSPPTPRRCPSSCLTTSVPTTPPIFSTASAYYFPLSPMTLDVPQQSSGQPGPGQGSSAGAQAPQAQQIPFSRRPDCLYFLRGACAKGDDCLFRHSEAARRGTQEPCEAWETYRYCDDPNCQHTHRKLVPPSPSAASVGAGSAGAMGQKGEGVQSASSGSLMTSNMPPVPPVPPSTSPGMSSVVAGTQQFISFPKRPDCMFYVRGTCSKGDHCVFRHNEKAKYGTQEQCPIWERTARCDDLECTHLHPKLIISPRVPAGPLLGAAGLGMGMMPGATSPPVGTGQAGPQGQAAAAVAAAAASQPVGIAVPYPPIPWVRRPDCLYFIRGTCTKGDKCVFRHSDRAKAGDLELCQTWAATGGTCADACCTHLHPKLTKEQQQALTQQTQLNAPVPISAKQSLSLNALFSHNSGTGTSPPGSPKASARSSSLSMPRKEKISVAPPTALTSRWLGDQSTASIWGNKPSTVEVAEDGRMQTESATVLATVPGNSLSAPQLADRIGVKTQALVVALAKVPALFVMSECSAGSTTPARVWLVTRDKSVEELTLVADVYSVLRQLPEQSADLSMLASVMQVNPPLKIGTVIRSHPEVFAVAGGTVKLSAAPRTPQLAAKPPSLPFSGVPSQGASAPSSSSSSTSSSSPRTPLSPLSPTVPCLEGDGSSDRDPVLQHVLEIIFVPTVEEQRNQVTSLLQPYGANVIVEQVGDTGHWLAVFCGGFLAKQALRDIADHKGNISVSVRIFSETTACEACRQCAAKSEWGKAVATPTIQLASGANNTVVARIRCDTPDCEVRYTLNGAIPGQSPPSGSTLNTSGVVTMDKDATVKAKAFKSFMLDSKLTSGKYRGGTGSGSAAAASASTEGGPGQSLSVPPAAEISQPVRRMSSGSSQVVLTNWIIPAAELTVEGPYTDLGGMRICTGHVRGSHVAVRFFDHIAPDDREAFEQEMSFLAGIRHPNLNLVYGICVAPDPFGVVTEYFGATSRLLDAFVRDPAQKLTERDKLKMAADIAKGMAYLHRKDRVHLNLNPLAVAVTEQGICKVCEYTLHGLVRRFNMPTHCNTSFAFVAPDLLLMADSNATAHGETSSPSSTNSCLSLPTTPGNIASLKQADVFSYGMLLWFLAARQAPFEGSTMPQVMALIARGKGRPKIPPTCLYGYGKLISRCWSQDPSSRPTFDAIVRKLDRLLALLAQPPSAN